LQASRRWLPKKHLAGDDLKEFIAWLKANPGKVSQAAREFGSVGTSRHLSSESRQRSDSARCHTAAPLQPMQDLVAGKSTDDRCPVVVLPQLRAGTIKAFAVLKKSRLPQQLTSRRRRGWIADSTPRIGSDFGCQGHSKRYCRARSTAAVVSSWADPACVKD